VDSLCRRYQATLFTSCHPPVKSSALDLPPSEKSRPSDVGRAATRQVKSQWFVTLRSWPIDLTQVLTPAQATTHAQPQSAPIGFMLVDVISVTANIRRQIKNKNFTFFLWLCFVFSSTLLTIIIFQWTSQPHGHSKASSQALVHRPIPHALPCIYMICFML
jgi:hypothetical protein